MNNSHPPPHIPEDLFSSLKNSKHVVVFTGAGVSAESGIPTFRDQLTGLWERFNAADLASPEAFQKDPALVWGWYEWRRMKLLQAQPNAAHMAIARLEKHLPALTLITQNVDDLHERAGSTTVNHLHGRLDKPRCFSCDCPHPLPPDTPNEPEGGRRVDPPKCTQCGGLIRPGVVWFGEQLPETSLSAAFNAAKTCDLLFVAGTSGVVMPAAEIPQKAKRAGAKVVEVNPVPTMANANWTFSNGAGQFFDQLLKGLSRPVR